MYEYFKACYALQAYFFFFFFFFGGGGGGGGGGDCRFPVFITKM